MHNLACSPPWIAAANQRREYLLGHTPTFCLSNFFNPIFFLSLSIFHPDNTIAMPPKKTAPAAKENVSLGPLAGDGMYCLFCYLLTPIY